MEKIRNIIVSTHDSLHPVKGGGALRTLKVAEEFKMRGHNVTIIAPTDGKAVLNGVKVYWLHAPKKQRSQILSSLKFNVRLLRKFLHFAADTDMFFVHNTISAASLLFLKIFFRFRYVLDITDIHAEYLPVGKRNIVEIIVTPILLFIEYRIIKSADRIIAVTNAMRNHLIIKGVPKEKIEVVYDGAETDRISTSKEPGFEKNIIHLGIVDRQHGVEYFIGAIPGVIKKRPDSKFFIIGGGRELDNIKRLAKSLGVIENCVFTGHLQCEEAREFLKKASIGVIPRQDNLPNRIITTLKLYEYWASGTAVVSSRLEGIAEIAAEEKNILFFKPGSCDDLAEKLISLLDDRKAVESMRAEGYRAAEKFRWSKLIPGIVDFALKQ